MVKCEVSSVDQESAGHGLGGPKPTLKLRTVLTVLKVVKSKQKKERVCDRDHIGPVRAKIFICSPSQKKCAVLW